MATDVLEPEVQEAEAQDEVESATQPSLDELKAAHYEEIQRMSKQVFDLQETFLDANETLKAAKKEYEAMRDSLVRLIRRDPAQRQLPLEVGDEPIENDAWRDVEVGELDISVGLVEKLMENSIDTLGELSDFWKANKQLTDFKGIGEEKAASVSDAFAEYGKTHPELFTVVDGPATQDKR